GTVRAALSRKNEEEDRVFVITTRVAFVIALLQGVSSADQHVAGGDVSPADSVRIVRGARSAQASFESFRRNRLPIGENFSGPCDVRIGRYCYWRGDGDDDRDPPPEPTQVRERRDALIRVLDSATEMLRGDTWLAGQHVRYLTEAGRFDDAIAFATSGCRATTAWCSALAGYAAHMSGRFAAADSAFSAALTAMEPAERCRWLDISDLLDDDLEQRFKATACEQREAFVRRVLWLGAPLYSVSQTDLLTEHLARLTRARIAEHSAAADGEPWADDERELMIRYGWPRWYTRSEPQFGSQLRPSIAGHDVGMPYDFLPSVHALDSVGHITPDDWHLDDARAVTGYAPSYARSIHELMSQVATFRRGDSTLVVAAWDGRRDTTLLGRQLDAALVLGADGEQRALTRRADAGVRGSLTAIGVMDSGVVSLELLAPQERRAARMRVGVTTRAASRIALSDLLLYSSSDSSPTELDAVIDSALANDVVPSNRTLGVYWETYGLHPSGEPVRYSLTVGQIGVGWLRRTAERLRLTGPTTGLRIQWEEVPRRADGIAGRGVRVDLSRLRAGRYRMQLTASVSGEAPVTALRDVDVR
ncbi:MAG TPA: hypothetical protein VFN86_00890, partial [Casimicrobiaceae bacterium]|nr:hypothetical protein [Casimicrobiaceae bacterium]